MAYSSVTSTNSRSMYIPGQPWDTVIVLHHIFQATVEQHAQVAERTLQALTDREAVRVAAEKCVLQLLESQKYLVYEISIW